MKAPKPTRRSNSNHGNGSRTRFSIAKRQDQRHRDGKHSKGSCGIACHAYI